MFTGTCFRHAENTIYFFSTYRNTSSCMAYAITKAGVRWFLDSYPMPMPLNLMALVGFPCQSKRHKLKNQETDKKQSHCRQD